MTRVMVWDRHASYREWLRDQLDDETDIEIVAEVEEAEGALELAALVRPDVVLLEAETRTIPDVELGLLRESLPELKVIVLAASQEEVDLSRLLAMKEGGADACLLTDAQKGEVASAIRAVSEGRWVAARAIAEPVLEEMLDMLVAERSRPFVCPNCGHEINRELMRARSIDLETALPTDEVMEFGELRIDTGAAEVVVRGEMVHLTPIEFKLLVALARKPGRVLSHQELLRRVWGYEFLGSGSAIPMAISRLRTKIERDPSNPSLITTVRGTGYSFHPEASD